MNKSAASVLASAKASVEIIPTTYHKECNISITPAFNADFDGDEMNTHYPSGVNERIEQRTQSNSSRCILSHQDATNIIRVVQDGLMAWYFLSGEGCQIHAFDFLDIIRGVGEEAWKTRLEYIIEKVTKLFGKGGVYADYIPLLNKVLDAPRDYTIHFSDDDNLPAMLCLSYITAHISYTKKYVDEGNKVVILDGIFLPTTLRSGSKFLNGLCVDLYKINPKIGTQFVMSDYTQFTDRWYHLHGSSFGLKDCMVSEEFARQMEDHVNRELIAVDLGGGKDVNRLFKLGSQITELITSDNELAVPPQSSRRDIPHQESGVRVARISGAKGSKMNETQIRAGVMQQVLGDDRPLSRLTRNMPFFPTSEANSSYGRGFISASYTKGLTPFEAFFHAQIGREGQTSTQSKVPKTGYAAKELSMVLSDVVIYPDGTLRNGNGEIVSFTFGRGFSTKFEKEITLDSHKEYIAIELLDFNDSIMNRYGRVKDELRMKMSYLTPTEIDYILSFMRCGAPGIVNDITNKNTENLHYVLRKYLSSKKILLPSLSPSSSSSSSSSGGDDEGKSKSVRTEIVNSLVRYIYIQNLRSMPAIGLPAGLVASSSISRPATQLGLDGKHLSAGGKKGKSLGEYIRLVEGITTSSRKRIHVYLPSEPQDDAGSESSCDTGSPDEVRSSSAESKYSRFMSFVKSRSGVTDSGDDTDGDTDTGTVYTHTHIHPASIIGISCSGIPYSNHDQAPRLTYGGSMSKQTHESPRSDFNRIYTTNPRSYHPFTEKPLIAPLLYSEDPNMGNIGNGRTLIVAQGPMHGKNQEDCICICRESSQGQTLGVCRKKLVKELSVIEGQRVSPMRNDDFPRQTYALDRYHAIDPTTGIARQYSVIKDGDILVVAAEGADETLKNISFVYSTNIVLPSVTRNEKDDEGYMPKGSHTGSSIIESITSTVSKDGCSRTIVFNILELRITEEGDKFAGQHGQKGVVRYVDRMDMPYTSAGVTPDIMINTLAYPSRMTQCMLLEQAHCKFRVSSNKKSVDIISEKMDVETLASPPLFDMSDIVTELLEDEELVDEITEIYGGEDMLKIKDSTDASAFKSYDFTSKFDEILGMCDNDLKETMYSGVNGEEIGVKVTISPCGYQKLKHEVQEKYNARGNGSKPLPYRQPTSGRKHRGGQKYGILVADALNAHGCIHTSINRYCGDSDQIALWHCSTCRSFNGVVERLGERICGICDSSENVSLRKFPYGSKWVIDMFAGMAVKVGV